MGMALFRDLIKEALPAQKIAAHLLRLLPDFTTPTASIGENSFVNRQESYLRRAVEAADIITIAMACNSGRVATQNLPFLLSNPVIAKAMTLFLTTSSSIGVDPISPDGDLHSRFIGLIYEITELYGQAHINLETALKEDFIEWKSVAAIVKEGVEGGLLSIDDAPYALSDATVLTYLIRALQLMKIMGRNPAL